MATLRIVNTEFMDDGQALHIDYELEGFNQNEMVSMQLIADKSMYSEDVLVLTDGSYVGHAHLNLADFGITPGKTYQLTAMGMSSGLSAQADVIAEEDTSIKFTKDGKDASGTAYYMDINGLEPGKAYALWFLNVTAGQYASQLQVTAGEDGMVDSRLIFKDAMQGYNWRGDLYAPGGQAPIATSNIFAVGDVAQTNQAGQTIKQLAFSFDVLQVTKGPEGTSSMKMQGSIMGAIPNAEVLAGVEGGSMMSATARQDGLAVFSPTDIPVPNSVLYAGGFNILVRTVDSVGERKFLLPVNLPPLHDGINGTFETPLVANITGAWTTPTSQPPVNNPPPPNNNGSTQPQPQATTSTTTTTGFKFDIKDPQTQQWVVIGGIIVAIIGGSAFALWQQKSKSQQRKALAVFPKVI